MVTSLEVWHKRVNKINEGGNEPSLSCHISPVKEYVRLTTTLEKALLCQKFYKTEILANPADSS